METEYLNIENLLTYRESTLNTLYDLCNYINESNKKVVNCKNCGAPLHNSKCEYCGTEY